MTVGTRGPALALTAAFSALALLAPSAQAASTHVKSGKTVLNVTKKGAKALKHRHIKLGAVAPAKVSKRAYRMPVKSGKYDFGRNRGTLAASGGLRLKRGSHSATLRALKVTLGKRSRLVAKVGSRKVTLAVLSLRKQQVHKSGGKRTVSHIRVRLSKRAATLVGRKLGGRALSARRAFASLKVQLKAPAGANGVPAGSDAKTGSAALRLAPAFSDALAVAGLDLSTLPGTDLAPDGSLNMSVLSSTIDPQTGQGTVALKGGFQLGSGANAVTITDPEIVIDSGGQDVYGQVNGVRTRIAGLDQTGLAEMLKGGATQLHNLLLTLSPEAAQALNQAGGATLFVPGTALGDISVSLPPGG